MQLQVLGCAGGIGGPGHTASFLIDHDVLVDAGTGVGTLTRPALQRIERVFLTHSHLDHVALLPMLADTGALERADPLIVHALEETVDILRAHVFNWKVWPDFTTIPSESRPTLRFAPIAVGDTVEAGGRRFTALPATHTVPAIGFRLDSGLASVFVSGDTTLCPPFWDAVGEARDVEAVIVEMSYSDANAGLARRAGHLCPSMLAPRLAALEQPTRVYLTHVKPSDADQVAREIAGIGGRHTVELLHEGQVLLW